MAQFLDYGWDSDEDFEETSQQGREGLFSSLDEVYFIFISLCLFFQILHNIWSSTNITEIVIILMQRLACISSVIEIGIVHTYKY